MKAAVSRWSNKLKLTTIGSQLRWSPWFRGQRQEKEIDNKIRKVKQVVVFLVKKGH